jgi:integrase-like protein
MSLIRVAETWVRSGVDTPKSEAGERTISLGARIAAELFEHRRQTAFVGDEERVFCSPTKGTAFDVVRFAATFRLALRRAKIEDRVRPFHDLRHTSITNAAAAGTSPAALMARAGHSDFKTTQAYIDLAGETFREEADRLERRLWGSDRYQIPVPNRASVANAANGPVAESVEETAEMLAVSRVRSGAEVTSTITGADNTRQKGDGPMARLLSHKSNRLRFAVGLTLTLALGIAVGASVAVATGVGRPTPNDVIDEPQQTGPDVTVAAGTTPGGDPWKLIAYESNQGLCLEVQGIAKGNLGSGGCTFSRAFG